MDFKIDQFKRANFFTGILANSQYWNDIQDYHFKKEQLYNRLFHGSGIVPGIMEELKITPVKKGGNLTILVGSGLAVDGLGRSLFAYDTQAKTIDYKKFKLPATVYVSIKYNESMEDYYQSVENPDFQGYKKRIENVAIETSSEAPDNIINIEIARIFLDDYEQGEIKDIKIPVDFNNPRSNEVDTRFVHWLKTARHNLSPYLRRYIVDVLDKTKDAAIIVNETTLLPGVRDLQTIALTGKMLVQCGDIDVHDIIHVFYPIYDINNHIIQEMLEYERVKEKRIFSSKDSFNDYRNNLFEMGELIKYYDGKLETLDNIIKKNEAMVQSLKNIIVSRKITYEDIALMSSDMPKILMVDDRRYTMVDYLDFNDPGTKERCSFEVVNTNDFTTTRSDYIYPDEVAVVDTVQRYVSGRVSFYINSIIRRKELLLIRRMDIFHGDYSVKVYINDVFYKDLYIDGFDTVNRWRNLSILFDEKTILEPTVKISFELGDSGRDNFGTIWFYQRL